MDLQDVGKRLTSVEKSLMYIHDDSDSRLTVPERDLLASTLILLCKLELAVLKRSFKETEASKYYCSESQVPDIMKEDCPK